MPQHLKSELRDRIIQSAAQAFAMRGYAGTSMASIAREAGVATGNTYRYFTNKLELFNAVVPLDTVQRFDAVLNARLASLARLDDIRSLDAGAAEAQSALLDFWTTHRWACVILLARSEGTPYAGFGDRFVDRLVDALVAARSMPEGARFICRQIFEGTRQAIVAILLEYAEAAQVRAAFAQFWRYQLAGLAGLMEGFE